MSKSATTQIQPTYFLSHGGGPWPWLKTEMPFFLELENSLKKIATQLPAKPQAILMISGHWEQSQFTLMSGERPGMLYDYYGFPPHTYEIKYPAPGFPMLALEIQKTLNAQGIPTKLDPHRGFDHGTFVPLFVMYPNADIPVVQLSLKNNLDPLEHIQLGRALRPLRKQGVLIVGSGLSFHNLSAFRNPESARVPSKEFDQWLQNTIVDKNLSERTEGLLNWTSAPSARFCHPREDHLIPLMVAMGAAEDQPAKLIYHELTMNALAVSSFRFG